MKRKFSETNNTSADEFGNMASIDNLNNINNINIGSKKLGCEGAIKTYCRIKPIDKENSLFKISDKENKILVCNLDDTVSNLTSKHNSFNFTQIFDNNASQVQIFQITCLPLITDLIKNRKSGLLFAYGLTNAGKTYTIIGDQTNPGILPLTLAYILTEVNNMTNIKPEIYCNFIEIYNEEVYDLLYSDSNNKKIKKKVNIKERDKLFYVQSKIKYITHIRCKSQTFNYTRKL
jgi:hypothetical protein